MTSGRVRRDKGKNWCMVGASRNITQHHHSIFVHKVVGNPSFELGESQSFTCSEVQTRLKSARSHPEKGRPFPSPSSITCKDLRSSLGGKENQQWWARMAKLASTWRYRKLHEIMPRAMAGPRSLSGNALAGWICVQFRYRPSVLTLWWNSLSCCQQPPWRLLQIHFH